MKSAAFLILCLAARGQVTSGPAPASQTIDRLRVERYLRLLEMWPPEVTVSISEPVSFPHIPGLYQITVHLFMKGDSADQTYFLSGDGQNVFKGDMYDLSAPPFQRTLDQITTDHQASFGAPRGAPVSLVVFSDFECTYCKETAKQLQEGIQSSFSKTVTVYYMDFPLDTIHPWARAAAIAGRCILRQSTELFWKYHQWMFDTQSAITPDNVRSEILQWADQNGMASKDLSLCLADNSAAAEVDRTIELGRTLGVDGTPTVFLNGRKLMNPNAQWQTLQKLIQIELNNEPKLPAAKQAPKK